MGKFSSKSLNPCPWYQLFFISLWDYVILFRSTSTPRYEEDLGIRTDFQVPCHRSQWRFDDSCRHCDHREAICPILHLMLSEIQLKNLRNVFIRIYSIVIYCLIFRFPVDSLPLGKFLAQNHKIFEPVLLMVSLQVITQIHLDSAIQCTNYQERWQGLHRIENQNILNNYRIVCLMNGLLVPDPHALPLLLLTLFQWLVAHGRQHGLSTFHFEEGIQYSQCLSILAASSQSLVICFMMF